MDLELLRNNALSFKKSAERCVEMRILSNGDAESLIVPSVVNFAFSIELYFKYILAKNNSPQTGHNLLKLFDSLDTTTKNDIIKAINSDEATFKLELGNHDRAFADWRYLHEKTESMRVNLKFMAKLANYLDDTVKR